MTNAASKLSTLINDLARLIGKEKVAIKERAFDDIAGFTERKETLLSEFDAIIAVMDQGKLPTTLVDELNAVRAQAQENAAILQAMADGAQSARQRLKSISEKDLTTGVYQPGGETLMRPDAATFTSKA